MRLVAIGLAAGIFSALFGVGGGIVAVPLLILLLGFHPRIATATSLGAIAITALAGVVVFGLRGEVNGTYAALVGIPAVLGALVGTTVQQRMAATSIIYASSLLLCGIAVWLLWP